MKNSFCLKCMLRIVLLIMLMTVVGIMYGVSQCRYVTIGDLVYSLSNSTATVIRHKDNNPSGELVIPSTVYYQYRTYDVTGIDQQAFNYCHGLTGKLIIPNSVIHIGKAAFNGCDGFTELTIGSSVAFIDDDVFCGCSGFTGNLTIPNSVTSIGQKAFYGCSGFTGNLTIPNSVTSIGQMAFQLCSGFTGGLTISNSVTTIGGGTFCGCNGFTGDLIIPNSVTSIGNSAFSGCAGFSGSLSIPDSVTYIGVLAFFDCTGLTSVTFPDSGKIQIDLEAFKGCINLTTISLPANICGMSSSSFINTGWYNNQSDGILYLEDYCLGYKGAEPTGELTIKNNTRIICSSAFANCSLLTSVAIPNSVTEIWSYAFSACTGLKSAPLPSSLQSIGNYAFQSCSMLSALILPNSLTRIGEGAFENCKAFQSLVIPNTVVTIENCAFSRCAGLQSIVFPNSKCYIGDYAFSRCEGLKSVVIPSFVCSIGDYAFMNCTSLKEIEYAAQDCSMNADKVFQGCSDIALFCGGVMLSKPCWNNCSALSFVFLDNIIGSVKERAFSNCENLTTVVIGESIRSINKEAFANNPRLNMVYYNVKKDLDAATDVFKNCPNLTTIHIGPDVEEIGSNIFKGCNTVHFVVALGPTPAILDAGAFSDIVDNSMLMVSCGNRVTYYSVWNMFPFNNIIEDCNVYPVESSVLGQGGSISLSQDEAQMGEEVQLTIMPNSGMYLTSLKVYNSSDPTQIIPVSLVGKTTSTYSFTMPPFGVAVVATFASGTSVSENTLKVPASIYPNPTSDRVTIEAENLRHVTIFNMQGQMVYESRANGNSFEYDFTRHVSGVYLIRVETADGVASKRVVVTK